MINNFKLYISDVGGVSEYYGKNITHLISISDPDGKRPYIEHFPRQPVKLFLKFHDIFASDSNHQAPEEKDIQKIIYFAETLKRDLENGKTISVLINCFAGISRSTAAAYIVLNILNPNKEVDNFNYLLQIRPVAIPNITMCDLADNLLDRGGRMSSLAREYRNKIFSNNAWSAE